MNINSDDFYDFQEFIDDLNKHITEKLELESDITFEKISMVIKAMNFLIIGYAKCCGYTEKEIEKCLSESVGLYFKYSDL